jgi:hypothetical protein
MVDPREGAATLSWFMVYVRGVKLSTYLGFMHNDE